MQFEPPLVAARLVRRYKRFLADVVLQDEAITVHCPNTGAMIGCDAPDSPVWLSHSTRAGRKYPWTWEQVSAGGVNVGINTSRSNALVREALCRGLVEALQGYRDVRAEVPYGQERSRADFVLGGHARAADCVVEVKNVTAVLDHGVAVFPDAISERGTRHLRELMGCVAAGRRAALVFCVQRDDVIAVRPADAIDARYGETLRAAHAAGVEIMAYAARVTPQETVLYRKVDVYLS